MRTLLLATSLIALAACSRADERASGERITTSDVEESAAAPSAPGIVPTSAPGVAFTYRYGFRMPDAAISAAQGAHAYPI